MEMKMEVEINQQQKKEEKKRVEKNATRAQFRQINNKNAVPVNSRIFRTELSRVESIRFGVVMCDVGGSCSFGIIALCSRES